MELNEKYDSAHIPNLIVVVDVGTINYAAEFVGGGKMGDLAPTGDDEFVIPPCYVQLIARKDGAFAINRLFTHMISHLAFFPRRPSIPPFNVLLEGTSSIQQHVGLATEMVEAIPEEVAALIRAAPSDASSSLVRVQLDHDQEPRIQDIASTSNERR